MALAQDWALTRQGIQQQHTDRDACVSGASPVTHAMFPGSSDEPEDVVLGQRAPGAPQAFLCPKALSKGTQLHST